MGTALRDLAFESFGIAVLVVDPVADRILDANAAAAKMLGYGSADLLKLTMHDLHEGQRPALVVFTQAVLAMGLWRTRSLAPRHAGGTPIEVEYTGSLLPGEPPRLTIAMIDLAAFRQRDLDGEAERYIQSGLEAWLRSERVFRNIERENQLILRAAGEGVYGVNADGITTFLNPAAERMLGWRAEDIVGRDMHTTIHHSHADGAHYPHARCPIYGAFRIGAVHRVDDEVFWRRDGSSFPVEYTSTPIRDRGAVVGAVIVFRDVSQRREAAEKLKLALNEVETLKRRLEAENAYLQEEIKQERHHHEILGRSASTQRVLAQIELVAATDAPVLIGGESGTGKELVARAIHAASLRHDRPLIRVNCATIPRDLFESEFFGHVKGAFTGAIRDRIGRFELAHGGTLFLDEIGEVPIELQAKLLRVLQEGQFERVGEERTRSIDVRIISASNRDLKEEVKARRFREDLYYRLNVFPITLAPLRERKDDIPLLAAHFLRLAAKRLRLDELTLASKDVASLQAYDWPGNIRELQNSVERAAILARDGRVSFDHPAADFRASDQAQPQISESLHIVTEAERLQNDRVNIEAALRVSGGKIFGPGGAAELLGIKPTTLRSRMKAFGIAWR
jgi:PAS domain S-box-containing protein